MEEMLTVKLSVVILCHETFWMWPPEGMQLGKGVRLHLGTGQLMVTWYYKMSVNISPSHLI